MTWSSINLSSHGAIWKNSSIIIYDLSLLIVLKANLEQMLFENEKIVLYLNTVKLQPTNI